MVQSISDVKILHLLIYLNILYQGNVNTNEDKGDVRSKLLMNTTIGHESEVFVHSCVADILFALLCASVKSPRKPQPKGNIQRECRECRYKNVSITQAARLLNKPPS